MAIVGGLPVYCPRTINFSTLGGAMKCGREMELLHIADGTEFDKEWCHAFYFCKDCNRSLMVNRRMDVVHDPEERI